MLGCSCTGLPTVPFPCIPSVVTIAGTYEALNTLSTNAELTQPPPIPSLISSEAVLGMPAGNGGTPYLNMLRAPY
jgi:hypothetical protein